jgi:hypothetical protein
MAEPRPCVQQLADDTAKRDERTEAVRALLLTIAETATEMAGTLTDRDQLEAQLLSADDDLDGAATLTECLTELMRDVDDERAEFLSQLKTLLGLLGMHAEAYLIATLRIHQTRQ